MCEEGREGNMENMTENWKTKGKMNKKKNSKICKPTHLCTICMCLFHEQPNMYLCMTMKYHIDTVFTEV